MPLLSHSSQSAPIGGTAEGSSEVRVFEHAQRLYRNLRLSDERGRFAYIAERATAAGYTVASAPGRGQRRRPQYLHGARHGRTACLRPDESLQGAQGRRPCAPARGDGLPRRTGSRSHADACAARRRNLRNARARAARRPARVRGRSETQRREAEDTDDVVRFAVAGAADGVPARSRICARSSRCSAAVRITARSASCRTCAGASTTGRAGAIVDEVRERVAGGAREITLVGQTVNAWRDPADGADFGDLCKAVARLPGLERLTFISPHPKDFSEKILDDLASVDAAQSAHPPAAAVGERSDTAAHESQVHARGLRRTSSPAFARRIAARRDHDRHHRRLSRRDRGRFRGDARLRRARRLRQCVHASSIRSGAGRRRRAGSRCRARLRSSASSGWSTLRTLRRARTTTVWPAARCARSSSGDSKKDATRIAAKTLDNVTVVAPKPHDYAEGEYARTPWLDVAVESAHVWGCSGRLTGRASRFADRAVPAKPPLVDLTSPGVFAFAR